MGHIVIVTVGVVVVVIGVVVVVTVGIIVIVAVGVIIVIVAIGVVVVVTVGIIVVVTAGVVVVIVAIGVIIVVVTAGVVVVIVAAGVVVVIVAAGVVVVIVAAGVVVVIVAAGVVVVIVAASVVVVVITVGVIIVVVTAGVVVVIVAIGVVIVVITAGVVVVVITVGVIIVVVAAGVIVVARSDGSVGPATATTATTTAAAAAAKQGCAAEECCGAEAGATGTHEGRREEAHASGIIFARSGEGDDRVVLREAEIVERAPFLGRGGGDEACGEEAVARIGECHFGDRAVGGEVEAVGHVAIGVEPVGQCDDAAIGKFDHQIGTIAGVADDACWIEIQREAVPGGCLDEGALVRACNLTILGSARKAADGEIDRRTHDTTPPQPPEKCAGAPLSTGPFGGPCKNA
ncbi:MAG: hypothetical protein O9328_07540 [Rhodobacteraceae bacterium]|nr:hypothetical protein [Paracoccaceae bacterium]